MSKLKLRKMIDRGKTEEDKYGTKIDDSKEINVQMSSGIKMGLMIQRAIANAKKHNVSLKPGKQNSGGGNCFYLSVIYNIRGGADFVLWIDYLTHIQKSICGTRIGLVFFEDEKKNVQRLSKSGNLDHFDQFFTIFCHFSELIFTASDTRQKCFYILWDAIF